MPMFQPIGAGTVFGLSTANTTAAATANTALIQAALNNAGSIQILTPGIYYTNATMFVKSGASITIGAGVTLKLLNGANCGFFTNANSRTAGLLLTSMTGWNNAAGTWYATCGATGIGSLYNVGDYIAIMDTDQQGLYAAVNKYYVGIHRVLTSTANQLTFEIANVTPGNGSGVTGVGSTNLGCYVFPVDQNIQIQGLGTLDGNGQNQTLFGAGDPRGCLIYSHNARYVSISEIQVNNGFTWCIASNYVEHYRVRNIGGEDRYSASNSGDTVHLSGWHSDAQVTGTQAASNDNIVGLTIDVCGKSGFTAFNFPYQYPGDMYDVTIRDVAGIAEGTSVAFAVVAVYGPAEYAYHGLTIDGVGGVGSSGVFFANYPATSMNDTNGENLVIRNIHLTNVVSKALEIAAGTVSHWTDITLEDVRVNAPSSNAVSISGSGTIGKLSVKNLYTGIPIAAASPWTVSPIAITGSVAIGTLDVSMLEQQNVNSGVALISHTGTGAIGRMTVEKVSVTGTTSGGFIASVGSTSIVNTLSLNNCQITNVAGAVITANTTSSINVFINSLTLGAGTACAFAASFAGPTNLFVNGYNEIQAPTNNPFQTLTAATAYSFRMENIGRDADSITKTAGNLRLHGGGARTAIANVNAPQPGDLVFNITGTVRVARNIANNAWVNLHT
jgi:hypothetical protein